MSGARVGRFEIVGRIAVGEGTERLLGRATSGRPVAIKRIADGAVRGSAAIAHPNLVEIITVEHVDDEAYLVTEYLEGEDLPALVRRLIKRRERLSFGLAAHIIAEVCTGLDAARGAGELHGAVSLDSVFVTYGGGIRLLDLGTATPAQAGGRSDPSSIGVVLYELTTLHRLASGDELAVPSPSTLVADYPPELEAIVMRALDPDPARRHRDAAELRDELLAIAGSLGLDEDPKPSLASKLMRLFGERVAHKRDLVDRVRRNEPLGDLVLADVDEEIEMPLAVRIAADTAVPGAARRARGTRWGVVILFVLAIAGGGAVGGWLRLRTTGVTAPADAPR